MNTRKLLHHTVIRERARRALVDLYHNATPRYPRDDDQEVAEFQAWFEDAARAEIDYIKDGGAYGNNYRATLAHPANAGRYPGEKARAYYVARGMRAMQAEREDCGALTGWDGIELAAGNKTRARVLKKIFKKRPTGRNNARWEYIGDYGKLYQWGRGGRTLAPGDLIHQGGGSSFGVRDGYADKLPIADVVRLVQVLESFNARVGAWCASVPEQWAEIVKERRAEVRAERKRELAKLRADAERRARCETYAG